MKNFFLFSVLLCSASWRVTAQDTTHHKLISIRPVLALEDMAFDKHALTGNAGVEVQFRPASKINVNFKVNGFLSEKVNAKSLLTSPVLSSVLSDFLDFDGFPPLLGADSSGVTNKLLANPLVQFKGATASLDVGIPFKLKDSSATTIEPFIGIEGKIYNRSTIFGEDSQFTFTEQYKFLSPTIGAKLNYTTKSKVKLTFRVSTSYPIIAKVKTDEKNLAATHEEVDLSKQFSHSLELGAKVKKMTIRFRYERVNIGQSDTLQGVSQPASKVNITGITIGYDF